MNRQQTRTGALGFGLCLMLAVGQNLGQTTTTAQSFDDAIAESKAMIESIVDEHRVPGVSVCVAVDGAIVWSEGFGFADLENQVPVTTSTRFRIASISKALTGTAAAVLAAQGRLDLDAAVQTYVASFPAKDEGTITVRQLAQHMSGIRHYRGIETSSSRPYLSLTDSLNIFADDALEHAPGARMTYTTYGYTLLGAAMEGACENTFWGVLEETVLGPLNMENTVVDVVFPIVAHRARPYEYNARREVINARATDHSYKIPGGGILSTAEDLVRFGSALLEPGFLEASVRDELFAPARLNDGSTTNYALGWNVEYDEDGMLRSYSHSGGQPGATSYLIAYPESGVVVATLCNIRGAPLRRSHAERIAEAFGMADEERH